MPRFDNRQSIHPQFQDVPQRIEAPFLDEGDNRRNILFAKRWLARGWVDGEWADKLKQQILMWELEG